MAKIAYLKVPEILYDALKKDGQEEGIEWSEKAINILSWHYTLKYAES